MLYFIHPVDKTTSFLSDIYSKVISVIGEENVCVFDFNSATCQENFDKIKSLPDDSLIVFLGHGRNDRLYGVEDESDEAFVEVNKMWVFDDKSLFALACHSSQLLQGSHHKTRIKHSIGFGDLPTSSEEIENIRKLRNAGVTDDDIEEFKEVIVDSISLALISCFEGNINYEHLYYHLKLLLYKKTNFLVLECNKRNLADLVYQMYSQMTYLRG
mgnify:CR=1 FL=1